ncbi:MAG: rubrerythrin [Candidatus Aminicenantes bacterium 4484_214]|nr:MAG: rubrerythrin [Candidatus Aminicenantes bacterium 4484_214]
MKKMTEKNLWDAFAGESQAHMKYMIFAEKAVEENLTNIARLFKANSYGEQIHARNHLRALGEIKSTAENVATAVEGEDFEVDEMYPTYIKIAQEQSEKQAEVSTTWALAAEKVHAELYRQAKEALSQGRDLEIGAIYVCPVCGFTMEGEAPEKCPVCNTPREKFNEF